MKKKILLIIAFILICTIGVWGITQYKTRALQNKVLIHESDTLSITIEPVIKEEENLKNSALHNIPQAVEKISELILQ